MMYLFFALIFIAYIYFGYKDDFKRDKINFKITVLGIFGILLIGVSIFYLWAKLETPLRKTVSIYYEDKLGLNKEFNKLNSKEDISKIDFDKLFKEDSLLKRKVDSVMSIYDILYFILFYLIVIQFNKFIRNRYILIDKRA
jgi:hypothetical protein